MHHISMISLKQIHYALAVAQTKHFRRAAEQCNVSQSALSTAISELETQLDIQIFERSNKQVLITHIGQTFLTKARSIKLGVEDLYLLSQSEKAPLSTPLSLGVIPTIGPFLLPQVLPQVRRQYNQLKLSIVEEQSHILVEQVRNGTLDTAILALPYPTEGLHTFEFWQEDFFVVTHKEEATTSSQPEISSEDLEKQSLLLLKEGHCLSKHALAACRFTSENPKHSLEGTSLYTLIQMVSNRMGMTLVPEMVLPQLVNNNHELIAKRLGEPSPHRRIAFITRLNYAGVHNIECLIKLFLEALQ